MGHVSCKPSRIPSPKPPVREEQQLEKHLEKHLHRSHMALECLRWRIKVCWFAIVLLFGVGIEACSFVSYEFFANSDACTFKALLFYAFYDVLFFFRLTLVTVAPPTDDPLFARILVATDVGMVLFERGMTVLKEGIRQGEWTYMVSVCSYYSRGLVFAAFGLYAALARDAVKIQERMWLGIACFFILIMLNQSFLVLTVAVQEQRLSPHITTLVSALPFLLVARHQRLRQCIQGELRRWIEGTAATRGAASLACLMGNIRACDALALARKRFRSVWLDQITAEILSSNVPDPELGALASPCALGACDAFLSHSWHDVSQAKWRALQAWGDEFVRQHGRQPSLWFDKCCIDQQCIDEDLQCLPIFLKGCKRLVVLCGPTYLSRLWCIVEIFTHVHMGGAPSDIELVQVLREGFEFEDASSIEDSFKAFDVRDCHCFDPADKQRMLAVIEASFGTVRAFSDVVRRTTIEVQAQMSVRSVVVPVPSCHGVVVQSSDSQEGSIDSAQKLWLSSAPV